MSRSLSRVGLVLVVLALLALPASADVYFVTLTNGTVVETARQPQQASWDPNMVLLLTEVGNWVGFPKDEIKNVRSEDPQQGFGVKISDKAIALGRAPNDLPGSKTKQEEAADRYLEYANRLLDVMEQRSNYSVRQFAEPNSSQGVPMNYGVGFSAMGSLGGTGGGNINTPTNSDGANSGVAFGGLAGAGAPPQ
ncbi:MAG TPA: hypothetical protein VGG20_19560 [Thermoanaerobaculia bacterium]|jgi:hypothetical protein